MLRSCRPRSPPMEDSRTRQVTKNSNKTPTACRSLVSETLRRQRSHRSSRGNQLLSFQRSSSSNNIYDYSMRSVSVSMAAQLHGMFFLAESSRIDTGDGEYPMAELTCYRRNLFQITGSVTLPRMMDTVMTERGERLQVTSQELCISATESVEGAAVKIISVPWKTPVNGAPPPTDEKTDKEPTSIPLDQSTNADVESEYSIYPIAWKRLQFRAATANNGRRKELQQHFTIKLSVVGTLSNGTKFTLCDAISGPIIVRGRSPRNFQARKDLPLSNSGGSMRKTMQSPPQIRRATSSECVPRHGDHMVFTGNVNGNPRQFDWRSAPVSSGGMMTSPHCQPRTAPVSPYMHPTTDLLDVKPSLKRKQDSQPVSISLTIPSDAASSSLLTRSAPAERAPKLPRSRNYSGSSDSPAFITPPASSSSSPYALSASIAAPGYGGNPSAGHHASYYPGAGPTTASPAPTDAGKPETIGDYYPLPMGLGIGEWAPSLDYGFQSHMNQMRATMPAGADGRSGRFMGEDVS